MNTKSILQSKTVWLQLIAFAAAFFPPVQAFLIANPVTSVAVLSSVNILVRFVTNGKITIFADGTDATGNSSGGLPAWGLAILTGVTAAGIGLSLPSCSASQIAAIQDTPIHARYTTPNATIGYSSKGGLDIAVDQTSGK